MGSNGLYHEFSVVATICIIQQPRTEMFIIGSQLHRKNDLMIVISSFVKYCLDEIPLTGPPDNSLAYPHNEFRQR